MGNPQLTNLPERSGLTARSPMPDAVRARMAASIAEAHSLADAGRVAEAWSMLEVAHILSQAWSRPHVKVHWTMLRLALRTRDRREISGRSPDWSSPVRVR